MTASLASKCPACQTVFRVVPDQLRVSAGWVRCGRCSEVFNATENLIDTGVTQSQWARLGLESEGPPPRGRQPTAAPSPSVHSTLSDDLPDIPHGEFVVDPYAPAPPRPARPPPRPAPPVRPAVPPLPPSRATAAPVPMARPAPPPPVRPPTPAAPMAPRPPPGGAAAAHARLASVLAHTPPSIATPPAAAQAAAAVAAASAAAAAGAVQAATPRSAAANEGALTPPLAPSATTSAPSQSAPGEPSAEPASPPAPAPAASAPAVPTTPAEASEPASAPAPARSREPMHPPLQLGHPIAYAQDPEPSLRAPAPDPQPSAPLDDLDDAPQQIADAPLDETAAPHDPSGAPDRTEPAPDEEPSGQLDLPLEDMAPVSAELRADPTDVPSFVLAAERAARWRRPWVRALLGVACLAATLLLLLQAFNTWRDWLWARYPGWQPAMQPLLALACGEEPCKPRPPRGIESLRVESSGLVRVERSDLYRLQVALRNQQRYEVALPALELALTDTQGQLIARRVLHAREIGARDPAIAAGRELTLQALLRVTAPPVAGYTIELFYP